MAMSACTPSSPQRRSTEGPFDWHLALERHAKGGEEGDGSREVVDDDADVVHSLDRHVLSMGEAERDCPQVCSIRASYAMRGLCRESLELLL